MSELMADGEPAALRRHAVLDEDDSAASLAVGQQAAFEALCRERLDFDNVELPAELFDRNRNGVAGGENRRLVGAKRGLVASIVT